QSHFPSVQDKGVSITLSNPEVLQRSRLVFLAVKPHIIPEVLQEISGLVSGDHIIVSMAAGITLQTLEQLLPSGSRVVRMMPNLPCVLLEGAVLLSCGSCSGQEDEVLLKSLLGACGAVDSGPEPWIDAHVGLSGSGVAFVYVMAEALADGAVKMGMPSALARRMAAQTVLGAGALLRDSGKLPAELRAEVCTPGGTTIHGLHALEKGGFRAAVLDAVEAATQRAQEMGRQQKMLIYYQGKPSSTPGPERMRNRSQRSSSSNASSSSERQPGLSALTLEGLRLESEGIWFDRVTYEKAESHFYARLLRQENGTISTSSPSSSTKNQDPCRHGNQEACHHVVQSIWVNKVLFDEAENKFLGLNQPAAPISLQIPTNHDEGYQSQTPTPPTPASKPINGLPSIAPPTMGVWLQKPLFDKAEALFYQNLYGGNPAERKVDESSNSEDGSTNQEGDRQNNLRSNKSSSKKQKKAVTNPKKAVLKQGSGDRMPNQGADCQNYLHNANERAGLDLGCSSKAETRCYATGSKEKSSNQTLKMTGTECLALERIWFEKPRYDEAERRFYEQMNVHTAVKQDAGANSILQDIARARENIQKSLAGSPAGSAEDYGELATRLKNLELENQTLRKGVEDLRSALSRMESRVSVLEKRTTTPSVNGTAPQKPPTAPQKEEEDEEDELDLFGSEDEEDEEAERLKEQRLQEYAAKKAKKPALVAKSSILLDVKPWDDETDMSRLEECVRSVQVDGLLWGASKLMPVGYGIKKLQISCVVEDDKVGTDFLEEEITKFEDYVQSVDVAAFNKI
ncbi:hypothetical protein DNTS_032297, partial [Danionella cerebrum]